MLALWVRRPYATRMYNAYCTGVITAREYAVRTYLYVWRWS